MDNPHRKCFRMGKMADEYLGGIVFSWIAMVPMVMLTAWWWKDLWSAENEFGGGSFLPFLWLLTSMSILYSALIKAATSRPRRFEVTSGALCIRWLFRQRSYRRADISDVRISSDPLYAKLIEGSGCRLTTWGRFGFVGRSWGPRALIYVNRKDNFVRITLSNGNLLLLTPERPEEFVASLAANTTKTQS